MKLATRIIVFASVVMMVAACGGSKPAPAPVPPAAAPAAPVAPANANRESVLSPSDVAQVYKFEDAGVQVTIPPRWSVTKSPNAIEIVSPGEEVYVSFQSCSASGAEEALAEIVEYIKQEVADLTLSGEPVKGTENGMPYWQVIGSSPSQNLVVSISLSKTPKDKIMAVYAELTSEGAQKFGADIEAIGKSFRPIQ
jgi:hypothetical protein